MFGCTSCELMLRLVDEHLRERRVVGEPRQHALDRDLAREALRAERRADEHLRHPAAAEPLRPGGISPTPRHGRAHAGCERVRSRDAARREVALGGLDVRREAERGRRARRGRRRCRARSPRDRCATRAARRAGSPARSRTAARGSASASSTPTRTARACAGSIARLASSRTSRAPPTCQVSCSSRKPPTSASLPMPGGIARRTTRRPVRALAPRPLSSSTGTSTTDDRDRVGPDLRAAAAGTSAGTRAARESARRRTNRTCP